MSKRQESLWTAFTRQQGAAAKRQKVADAEVHDGAARDGATVRRRRLSVLVPHHVEAEDGSTPARLDEEDEDGDVDAGSVTDGDVISSQEDVAPYLHREEPGQGHSPGETTSDLLMLAETRPEARLRGMNVCTTSSSTALVGAEMDGLTKPDDGAANSSLSLSVTESSARLHPKKQIKDSVHGMITFEPICMRIIDTLQFQRLRNLHQLGAANYVYIGATHSRFEHCLGVAYLAERMVESIRTHQPWLPITKTDVLCIKIAGLCHDLGHGPFSHVFDGIFLAQLRQRNLVNGSFKWSHEQGSIDMLDYLLVANSIDIAAFGLTELDLIFIKELIYGGPLPKTRHLRGRPSDSQSFLYDFVNNSKSGLDVDKLDYFMRDAVHTGVKMSCDTDLLIRNARVLPDYGDPERKMAICFPEKLAGQVMQAFHTRFELHQSVYQHKVVRAIEYMICDVFIAANEHLHIKNRRFSDMFHCMEAYQHLDDRVLARIQESDDDRLKPAQTILNRILTKPNYEYIGKTAITDHSRSKTEGMLLNEVLCSSPHRNLVKFKDRVILEFMRIHYGKGDQDPVKSVRFYCKNARATACCYQLPQEAYDMFYPNKFEERAVRVFVKDRDLALAVREAFQSWCTKYNNSIPFPLPSRD